MTKPFKVGIAGLGTVGCGVVDILQKNGKAINARAERPIDIVAVSARTRDKKRDIDISTYDWVANPIELATRADIDCVIEVMGGEEGAALELVRTALQNGKHVITANKAMLAHHGHQLALLAEAKNLALSYEAAVAGGIPVIRAIREGLSPNSIQAVHGILNGTCNYILTQMRTSGRDFNDVLKEAQAKGYAESDPTFDVDGIDAAHKLSLLAALSFGVMPDFPSLDVTGIRAVTLADIKAADALGYKIKLLGSARKMPDGAIAQVVAPALVMHDSPMAGVEDVYNAVMVEGDYVGKVMLEGRGAGGGPTATSIVADLTDLARGEYRPIFGIPAKDLPRAARVGPEGIEVPYYIRLHMTDGGDLLPQIEAALSGGGVVVEKMFRDEREDNRESHIAFITREIGKVALDKALADIGALADHISAPLALRIER